MPIRYRFVYKCRRSVVASSLHEQETSGKRSGERRVGCFKYNLRKIETEVHELYGEKCSAGNAKAIKSNKSV